MRSLFTASPSRLIPLLSALLALVCGEALELDDTTLDKHVDFSKHTLVMFYAPWYVLSP